MNTNATLRNTGLLLLRLCFGGAMLTHGYPKMMKLFSGDFAFADPFGIGEMPSLILAVIGEVIAPVLLILGWNTRLAAIPAAITMGGSSFYDTR